MMEYIIIFIIGFIVGVCLCTILGKNTTTEELEAAYQNGRMDEKQRITDEMAKLYNIHADD